MKGTSAREGRSQDVASAEKRTWCGICEASCGLIATVEGGRIQRLRPDPDHPGSRGFACPKGIAFGDVVEDPDRVVHPLRRMPDGRFVRASWDEALDDIGRRLRAVIDRDGRESIGMVVGNPASWNYAALFLLGGLAAALKTKHLYTSSSTDINNYLVVGELVYGHGPVNPLPDFARTDFALIIGANPFVSHGSMVTTGRIRDVLLDIPKRGGRVVVVDPRRSETARHFEHVAIRPDSDAWLLGGMLHVLFAEDLVDRAAVAEQTTGAGALRAMVELIDLDRAAEETGIPRATIDALARDLAGSPSACIYGRCGASLGQFSTLTKFFSTRWRSRPGTSTAPAAWSSATPCSTSSVSRRGSG